MKRYYILSNLIKTNNYKTFVEVGVAAGTTSYALLRLCPDLTVHCVDPYEVYKGYEGSHLGSAEELQKKFEIAKKHLFSDPRCIFYREYSIDAVKRFLPEEVDVVFIDGNHFYKWVKEDIEAWYPIVRKGGILSGHDYVHKNGWGVQQAVREFVTKNNLELKIAKDHVWYCYK